MRIIVLNQKNLINDGNNNTLIYKFPNSVSFENNSVAVSSVNMYYSWFNIANQYGNTTFSYNWYIGSVLTTYNIIIPDGLYEITDLNAYLQFEMIKNGTYLIDASTKNVYYAEFILNPTRYAVQINTFLVPTILPTGFTVPSNFVGLPTIVFNPQITIGKSLNVIIGFSVDYQTPQNQGNTYIAPLNQDLIAINSGTGTISCLSTQAPNVQPNSSIYISMSNINNPYALPSSIIYSIVPTGAVGTLITNNPPQFMWNQMINGTYNELRLSFLGTDLSPIKLNDPQMTILLAIKDATETGLK